MPEIEYKIHHAGFWSYVRQKPRRIQVTYYVNESPHVWNVHLSAEYRGIQVRLMNNW